MKLKSKQDAVEQDAFCELSTHYWGFGNSTKMTALGTFFISQSLPGKYVFQTCTVSVRIAWKVKSLQTNNIAIRSFIFSAASPIAVW